MAVKSTRRRSRGGAGASRRTRREPQQHSWRWMGRRLGTLALAGALTVGAGAVVWLMLDARQFPVRHIAVYGELRYLGPDALGYDARPYLGQNFFRADIDALRARLADNPWVARVRVSRTDGLSEL